MSNIFEKIIRGEIPCAKVYEDDDFLAFLDVFPVTEGHTLVIPKKSESHLMHLDEETYAKLMQVSKKVGMSLQEKTSCERICMSVIGWEVPHVHVHLIPTNSIKDLNFGGPKRRQATPEELQALSDKLRLE